MVSTAYDATTKPVTEFIRSRYESIEMYVHMKSEAATADISDRLNTISERFERRVSSKFDEASEKAKVHVEQISKTVSQRLEEITRKVEERVEEVSKKATDYAQAAAKDFGTKMKEEIGNPLQGAFDSFKRVLKDFTSKVFGPLTLPQWAIVALESVMVLIFFVVAVRFYMKQVSGTTLACFLAALFPLPLVLFLSRLYDWCQTDEEADQVAKQAKDQPTKGDFWTAFTSLFPGGSGLEKGGYSEGIPRFKRLIDAVSWFCSNAWQFVVWCYTKITGVPIPTSPLEEQITQIASDWRPIYSANAQSGDWYATFRTYPHTIIDVNRLFTRAKSLDSKVYHQPNGVSPALTNLYTQILREIQDASARADAFLLTAGERACPWWLNIFGLGGLGKTVAANEIRVAIIRYMYLLTGDPAYAGGTMNDVFMIPQGETFFDGYAAHKMGGIDDIFQASDAAACQPLALFLMPFISTCPCPLLCADPGKKGKACVMDFLVTTSNDAKFTNLGIRHPENLHNRIALNVELVHVDKKYNVLQEPNSPDFHKRMFRLHSNYNLEMHHLDATNGMVDLDTLVFLCVRGFLKQKSQLNKVPDKSETIYGPDFKLSGPRYCVEVKAEEEFKEEQKRVPEVREKTFREKMDEEFEAVRSRIDAKMHQVEELFTQDKAVAPDVRPADTQLFDSDVFPSEPMVSLRQIWNSAINPEIRKRVQEEEEEQALLKKSKPPQEESAVKQTKDVECSVQEYVREFRQLYELKGSSFVREHPAFKLAFERYSLSRQPYASYVQYNFSLAGFLMDDEVLVPLHPLLVAYCSRSSIRALRIWWTSLSSPNSALRQEKTLMDLHMRDLFTSVAGTRCLEAAADFVQRTEEPWDGVSKIMPFLSEIIWPKWGLFDTSSPYNVLPRPGDPLGREGYERFIEEMCAEEGWRRADPKTTYREYLWGVTAIWVCQLLKGMLIFIATIVVVKIIINVIVSSVISFFSPKMSDELEEQSGAPKGGGKGHKGPHTPRAKKVIRALDRAAKKQTKEDPLVEHIVNQSLSGEEAAVLSNLVKVSFNGAENWLLGVRDNLAVTTTHSVQKMREGMVVRLNCKRQGSVIDVKWEDVQLFYDGDDITEEGGSELVWMCFPTVRASLFRDISSYFVDLLPSGGLPASRFTPSLSADDKFSVIQCERTSSWTHLDYQIAGCQYEFRMMSNAVGYCGLPYMTEVNGKMAIIAIHGAGREHSRVSLGHEISKKEVDDVIKAFKELDDVQLQCAVSTRLRFDGKTPAFPILSLEPQHFIPGTHPLGVLPLKHAVHLQSETNLEKTPLHPDSEPLFDSEGPIRIDFVPERCPARLTPGPGYFPAAMPLNKYGEIGGELNVTPPIDPALHASLPFEQLLPPDFVPPRRILTIDEAINGSVEMGVSSIDLTKSPGYPYINTKFRRPQVLFSDVAARTIRPAFRKEVETLQKQLETEVVPCVVVDCLKDELLPFEDVKKGKVRIFCTAELIFVVLAIMFFEGLLKALSTFPWKTPISIGLDPHTMWTELYSRLRGMSPQCMAGDFKGQEFTIPPEYVGKFVDFCDFINPLLGNLSNVRRNLIFSLFSVFHIFQRDVYYTWKGQGSGTGPTALFASFCSWVFHVAAWRSLGYSDVSFPSRVACTFMGDDSVVAVKETPAYNMLYLASFARTIGMYYTSADKGVVSHPYSSFDGIEYLRRGFRVYSKSLVLAPLRLSSILENPMWEKKGASLEDERNSWLSVFIDLAHHPEDLYERTRKVALRYSARVGLGLIVPPYKHAFDRLRLKIGE
jgi:hypothetical protein